MPTRSKAPVVQLETDVEKVVESILFLMAAAQKLRKSVTQYDIVKSLFLADRSHLNTYGRPITFDNYYAMKHGPVPTFAYNLLKEEPNQVRRIGGSVPWKRERRPNSSAYDYVPYRDFDAEKLAPSEMELLEASLQTVKSLGFGQVRKLTHEDAAYIDAWEGDDENDNSSYPMSLSMLFDVPDKDLAADLQFVSANTR